MTQDEHLANRHLQAQDKISHSASSEMKRHLSQLLSSDPDVLELVSGGMDAFAERTAERIMAAHAEEIYLNLCPRSGKIAKTPEAK